MLSNLALAFCVLLAPEPSGLIQVQDVNAWLAEHPELTQPTPAPGRTTLTTPRGTVQVVYREQDGQRVVVRMEASPAVLAAFGADPQRAQESLARWAEGKIQPEVKLTEIPDRPDELARASETTQQSPTSATPTWRYDPEKIARQKWLTALRYDRMYMRSYQNDLRRSIEKLDAALGRLRQRFPWYP